VNSPVAVAPDPPIELRPSPALSQPRQRDTHDLTATRDGTLRELRGRSGFHTKTTEVDIVVDIVFPRTPADLAGMERGDVIVRVVRHRSRVERLCYRDPGDRPRTAVHA